MGPVQELMNRILAGVAVTSVGMKMAAEYEQKSEEARQAAAASLAASLAEKTEIQQATKGGAPE